MITKFTRAGVILVCDDTYLVVQGRKSNKWSFPKGHRENNENALETAMRELEEETGIILDKNIMYTNIISYYNFDYVYYCFNVDNTIVSPCINDTKEIKKVEWVKLSELILNKYNKNTTLKLYVRNMMCRMPKISDEELDNLKINELEELEESDISDISECEVITPPTTPIYEGYEPHLITPLLEFNL